MSVIVFRLLGRIFVSRASYQKTLIGGIDLMFGDNRVRMAVSVKVVRFELSTTGTVFYKMEPNFVPAAQNETFGSIKKVLFQPPE